MSLHIGQGINIALVVHYVIFKTLINLDNHDWILRTTIGFNLHTKFVFFHLFDAFHD